LFNLLEQFPQNADVSSLRLSAYVGDFQVRHGGGGGDGRDAELINLARHQLDLLNKMNNDQKNFKKDLLKMNKDMEALKEAMLMLTVAKNQPTIDGSGLNPAGKK
jgi:hypothetical protein